MKIKCKKLHPAAILPTYATDGSGCFDLYAARIGCELFPKDPLAIGHGDPILINTGLSFEIPEGHVMLIFSRSGHAIKHDTRLANAVGVIDSDYRGPVIVKLCRDIASTHKLFVNVGARIAQAMIIPVPTVEFEEVDELSETARDAGGFGSTGN